MLYQAIKLQFKVLLDDNIVIPYPGVTQTLTSVYREE